MFQASSCKSISSGEARQYWPVVTLVDQQARISTALFGGEKTSEVQLDPTPESAAEEKPAHCRQLEELHLVFRRALFRTVYNGVTAIRLQGPPTHCRNRR